MRKEAGFTLIEILAGGVISTVLAGAMLSLFYLVTGNIKDSAANSRLLRIQTVAEDQLRRTVRRAYGAKLLTEIGTPPPAGEITIIAPNDANAHPNQKEIWLYEDPDALIGAYRITFGHAVDTLLEWVGGNFIPMHIGSDTVFLDGGISSFSIFPYRLGVAFNIGYQIQENGKSYAAPTLNDSVLCRGRL